VLPTADSGVAPTAAQDPAAALPSGSAQVTVVDAASRSRLLNAALLAAARTQGPSYTPLWLALLAVLILVFAPMLVTSFVSARRRRRNA
jgi:hypothetical protein